ncbi:glycosyltransferase [Loigolactobacillus coryniformis]|uniref:glycosyltransferase n=1 Tax=Loigolactobacillus coryniformis TaxID=1610 RepID=UPI00201ACBC9|nr:glycosyltransferase [Loigolactobacillus coryniformis]MCL5457524.1 glycosyltransferase [Loigolactobacillus coryniformis]
MINKKVSFIVPVYHIGAIALSQCVESLLAQTYNNIEILLIDDGSTVVDANKCDELQELDSRIIVAHCENKGVSQARNKGIDMANGDILIFVDPDDNVNELLAERCVQVYNIDKFDVLLYKSTFSSEIDMKATQPEVISKEQLKLIIYKVIAVIDGEFDFGACWGKAFSSDFLEFNRLRFIPDIKKAQDRLFMYDSYLEAQKVLALDFIGYNYNSNNDGSVSRKFNPNIINILNATALEFQKRVQNSEEILYRQALNAMHVRFIYEILQLYLLHKNNTLSFSNRKNYIKKIVNQNIYRYSISKVKLRDLTTKSSIVVLLLRLHCYGALTFFGYYYLNK